MGSRVSCSAVFAIMLVSGACSPSDGKGQMADIQDDHFTCAAMISAADRLVGAGKLGGDALPVDKMLAASMGHLNAWAIPKGLKEEEAFEAVNKERERLLADLEPEEIATRARACIASMSDRPDP